MSAHTSRPIRRGGNPLFRHTLRPASPGRARWSASRVHAPGAAGHTRRQTRRSAGCISQGTRSQSRFTAGQQCGRHPARPDGQWRRSAQAFPARHRCGPGRRRQGECPATDGDVVRLRGRLPQYREVRADGDRLLGDARAGRTAECVLPAGRDGQRSRARLHRFRRSGDGGHLVQKGYRTRLEGARQPDASRRVCGTSAWNMRWRESRPARATRRKRRNMSLPPRRCWMAIRRWPDSRRASSPT